MSVAPDRVCVVIGRTRHKMVGVELEEAAEDGAKFVELRLDFLAHAPDLKRLLANKTCPVVATVRRAADGGRWSGTEEARLALLRQCIVGGFDWVDLETDIADKIRRFGRVKRIVSYHNFTETPADLEAIYQRMCQQDADVVKLAVTARTPEDNFKVLNLIAAAPQPTVAHCMGELGFASRILSLKYGAPFMYAAYNKERGIAPGMPSFDEVRRIYGVDRIDRDTFVYALLGDPVSHSHGPMLHNALFRKLNLNALYLPLRVAAPELTDFINAFQALPVHGYSVTIPHKEAAAALASECDETVVETKAANTLIWREEGGFTAHNTDYAAAQTALDGKLPPRMDGTPGILKGTLVLLLGAGGVSRAIAYALVQAGAFVTIASRTSQRAADLAAAVGCKYVDWQARHQVNCDVVINGTPVGMHPNVDESPLHASFLKPGLTVFDTVYTPETTLLVKEARARGCTVVTGVDMFVRQAAKQFAFFTGIEPPLEPLAKFLRKALSPVILKGDPDDEDEAE